MKVVFDPVRCSTCEFRFQWSLVVPVVPVVSGGPCGPGAERPLQHSGRYYTKSTGERKVGPTIEQKQVLIFNS